MHPTSRARVALGERALDLVVFAAVVTLGLLVRWPYLWSAPRFTDEIHEVLRGLSIAQGRLYPLTSVDSYIGAIQNYTFALVFLVGGQNAWSPRLISWFMGGLTVGLTYLLSVEIARSAGLGRARMAGFLAALMMSMAGVHVIVNSHIAWSNSVTPFYTTLGLWLVLRVMRARTTWPMAVAGFSFGCALQTHLLAGMFFPAVIALVIWKARWLLKDRWTYLGIGAFLAAYSSVIVHNLMYLGDTVKHAQYIRTRHNYLVDGPLPETDSFTILRNMGRTIGMLGETLVTSIGPADDWPGSIDPVLIAVGLISVAFAVVWALRRGQPLPILALLATVLILPVANPGRYTTITDGRYVSPLLPLCFAALAAMLLAIPMSRKVRICAIGAMALVFILQPLGPTLRYGQRVSEEVPSNQAIARSVDVLESWGDESDLVMLDNRLNQGARNIISLRESRAAFDGFTYLLPFERIRVVTTQVSRGAVEDRLRRRDRVFVIVPPGYRSELLVGRVTPIRSADAPAPPDPAAPHRPLYEMYMVEKISGASDSAVPGADVAPAAAP